MSSVNSLYSSSSRVTGMLSNMDTDSIVESMCSGQQSKVDKKYQEKTIFQWKDATLTDISDDVKEFTNTYCSVLGSSSMLKASTYVTYSASTSDTSGAVSITAGTNASVGSVSVSVQQLAENSSVSSSSKVSSSGELASKTSVALDKLDFSTALKFNSDKKISFSINGKAFTFSSDTTLQSMISTINADSDANVTMKYSRLSDKFTITADSGGKDSAVTIQNISGNAFGADGAFGIDNGKIVNGQNAWVTIDGTTIERNSNNFEIDGLTYNINAVTSTKAASTDTDTTTINGVEYSSLGSIIFDVKHDYSSTVKSVETFVSALNDLITKITSATTAKDYSADYPPLTEKQKEDMTEKQIEKWESKAKNGVLRYDSTLETLVSGLKNAFFSSAGGTGLTAASIGISTASYFGDNAGLLEVDATALTAALESNPDSVLSIFTGGNSTSTSDNMGVLYKIKAGVSTYSSTTKKTLKSMDTKMDAIDKETKTLKSKLSDLAAKYYKKFSAMETALSKLNSTSSYVSSLFSK